MKRNIDRYALALLIVIGVWVLIYWLRPSVRINQTPVLVTLDDRAPAQSSLPETPAPTPDEVDETARFARPDEGTPAVEETQTATPAPNELPARGRETLEYVVKKGDTLTGIAFSHYGRSRDWVLIFNANRLLLDSPEDLRPGMRLIIPPALDADGDPQQ